MGIITSAAVVVFIVVVVVSVWFYISKLDFVPTYIPRKPSKKMLQEKRIRDELRVQLQDENILPLGVEIWGFKYLDKFDCAIYVEDTVSDTSLGAAGIEYSSDFPANTLEVWLFDIKEQRHKTGGYFSDLDENILQELLTDNVSEEVFHKTSALYEGASLEMSCSGFTVRTTIHELRYSHESSVLEEILISFVAWK